MTRTVWVVFFLLGSAFASGSEALRVAVAVDAPDRGGGWQAMITAQLSQRDVTVVEREKLADVLAEQEVGGVASRALSNVDIFLHFRRVDGEQWLIESVDAASGHLLGSASATAANPDTADALANAAAALLEQSPAASKEAPRLAVVETGPRDAHVFLLATRLREVLAGTGFAVLDRALTQGVVEEKSGSEHGWREELSEKAFLGADVFVELAARNGQCAVQVFRSRDGKLIESRESPLEGPIDGILQWLLPALDRTETSKAAPYLPTVETEALEPFYRGLSEFDQGRYAEASAEFSRAFLLNDKFRDALLWEARCYDALDLGQLAAAVRRYEKNSLVGNGASGSARTSPAEAVAFLGIEGGPASLSAAAASALARTDHEIHLPDTLARLRREYDWMAGLTHTEGARWEQAPSFFCRLSLSGVFTRSSGAITVHWTLSDTVLGKVLARRALKLSENSKDWPGQMKAFLPGFLNSADAVRPPRPEPSNASAKTLEVALLASRGLDANAALVKLLLADPANPFLRAKGFERGQSPRDGLDAFLNFALRDTLLARLPRDSALRTWLELSRLFAFLETEPVGHLVTDERPDVPTELETFASAHSASPAALVARYALLYERQDEMPPEELAQACNALLAELRGFPQSAWVAQMTASLRDYARIAGGETGVDLPDIGDKNLPRRLRIRWMPDGWPELVRFSDWSADAYAKVALSDGEKVTEARAVLAINGRPGDRRKIQARWLTEFPRSLTLAAYVVSALHELNFWHGKPLGHALDWDAERDAFLNAITFAAETLEFWIDRAETPSRLDQLEDTVWAFFMTLNERVYLGVLPDAQYLALRDRLAQHMQKADARVGRSGWAWRQPKFLAWQDVTPAQARELRHDRLNDIGREIFDREVLRAQIRTADEAARGGKLFDPQPLWRRLRGWDINDTFTAPELAVFYLAFTPEVVRRFRDKPPTVREAESLIEHAIALLNGGARPEAETLFRLILEIPADDTSAPLRANAAFRLAQIFRVDGRKPEAIAMARRGLEISGLTSWALVGKYYDAGMQRVARTSGIGAGLSAHFTRLLGELRFDPQKAELPPGVSVVAVPTPNLDNPALNVFYRAPIGPSAAKRRVLVLIPSLNHDVLEALQPGSPWTRFADEHDIVLVTPRFYATERAERAKHAFTYFQNAQIWSGNALLAALDKIAERTPIQTDRLLLHGYGAGAGFAARFARWRPDRVAAASLHGGGISLPWFQEYPSLLPLHAVKDVRFLITAGENDNFAESTQNRFACAEAFVTVLRGAGATVEWKPFPGVGHFPTAEMEGASREFLIQP